MRKEGGKIYIGTSGWQYKHWKGSFYPIELKLSEHFNFYSRLFGTVEINNSFYKLPSETTFTHWKETAPENFVYAVKANRFITHMKKLKDPVASIEKFFRNVDYLEHTLGPILFQLPPRWRCNENRLHDFLQVLPSGYQYAMEFRESSWYNERIYELLKAHNVAFCIYELEHHQSPCITTASHIYVRLHGPGRKYEGKYSSDSLKNWASQCKKWIAVGKDIFFYFDNDQHGYAAENALYFREVMEFD